MTATGRSLEARFRQLVVDLEQARSEGLATYSPQAFGRALECYGRARQAFAALGTEDAINAELDQAFENLKIAAGKARASAELLSSLIETRSDVNQNEQVRFRAPGKLQEAERAYRQATDQAEEGKAEAARESVANAQYLYRDASLTALQGGLIGNLGSQVTASLESLGPEARSETVSILASLESDLDKARAGGLDPSDLNRRIAAAGHQVSALIGSGPDIGLEPGIGLPDRVFDPGPPGWAPGTFGPPTAPVTMRITERTAGSLTFIWHNIPSLAEANAILRREGDGPWEVVAELDVLGEWQTYTDSGLLSDRLYCYRVQARNSYGSSTTSFDNMACGYTRDGNDLALGRIQLRIRVADIPNAGTDDPVRVRLSSPLVTYSPSGNGTWLDYGPLFSFPGGTLVVSDDFDRGREFTYDLNLTYLNELSDITMISIRKDGSDKLAIAELALIVNGVTVFDRHFGETSSTAQWIGNGASTYTVSHPELRAHSNWPISFPLPSLQIPNQELVERMEGLVGDAIHGTDLQWGHRDGGDWVGIARVDDSTLHVTLDLEAEVLGPNLEVDLEFDLNVSIVCSADTATLMLATSNFSADVSFGILHDILSVGIVEFFDDDIERAIEGAWQPIAQSFDFTTGGLCPIVEVDENGNLNFSLS